MPIAVVPATWNPEIHGFPLAKSSTSIVAPSSDEQSLDKKLTREASTASKKEDNMKKS